jgi:hypothetical protein
MRVLLDEFASICVGFVRESRPLVFTDLSTFTTFSTDSKKQLDLFWQKVNILRKKEKFNFKTVPIG